ncbi:MAG: acyl-phosphate glycerol 3-phosphate acyltransferase [Ignavibacteriae bacterium]|nr:MAG: acyl-phosphate glycerol 3-phosphate acyltransferase [Ignavibacteriota bacterium]
MELFLVVIFSYLIGSLPTAYLTVKSFIKKDITKEGSGNVGTYNTFDVTKSKEIAALVLIIDLLKGLFPVIITKYLFGLNFQHTVLSLVFAVIGHCFSIWLKFKGGRGLATAAGGLLLLSPFVLFEWLLIWFISYKIKKDIVWANIFTSVIVFFSIIIIPDFFNNFTFPKAVNKFIFSFYLSLLLLIILIKHRQPFIELIQIQREKNE